MNLKGLKVTVTDDDDDGKRLIFWLISACYKESHHGILYLQSNKDHSSLYKNMLLVLQGT